MVSVYVCRSCVAVIILTREPKVRHTHTQCAIRPLGWLPCDGHFKNAQQIEISNLLHLPDIADKFDIRLFLCGLLCFYIWFQTNFER